MSIATELAELSTAVATTYRAKDVEMAARIDSSRRLVLITGAIDTNEHDILVRVELPSAGTWQVVKSETNLTTASWYAWQISLGEGTSLSESTEALNLSRQYSKLHVADHRERFAFYGGCVRPGEAILKMFTVDSRVPRIVMSHSRFIPDDDEFDGPSEEIVARKVEAGFPSKPYIEAFLPTETV